MPLQFSVLFSGHHQVQNYVYLSKIRESKHVAIFLIFKLTNFTEFFWFYVVLSIKFIFLCI
jgi:hypothetical protein